MKYLDTIKKAHLFPFQHSNVVKQHVQSKPVSRTLIRPPKTYSYFCVTESLL